MQTTTKFSNFENKDLAFLRNIVGEENVSVEEEELVINAMDSFPGEPVKPDVVVWPDSTEQISKIMNYANERKLPVVPRGGGSSLSGNVVPVYHGVVLSFKRMKRILEVHEKDLQVVVQPGVVPDELNVQLAVFNLFFPPDPGSSSSCTIGGMVANNASGMGAVKYGVTRDYVLKLEAVLPNGQVVQCGSNAFKSSTGYDLIGLFVGSEGTLGVITEITLKLRTLPQTRKTAVTYFDSVSDTTDAVSEMIGSGLNPASLEFLDHETILAVNQAEGLGLSEKAAMLLTEFHGTEESATYELNQATEICKKHHLADMHVAKSEEERKKLWAGRKGAYPSLLRASPNTIIGDIVVPASKITNMVTRIYEIAATQNVRVACFGHCGDGNVHPNIMADRKNKENWERATKANEQIVEYAIKLGGVASGEHGIGLEKKQFMQLEHGDSLELMKSIKKMFDPNNILNPGKFFDL